LGVLDLNLELNSQASEQQKHEFSAALVFVGTKRLGFSCTTVSMSDSTLNPAVASGSVEPTSIAVWADRLNKTYRTGFWLNRKVESLKDCSIAVPVGETFGLLGPNGAGKTTLLKILLGLVQPTSGRATILGRSIADQGVRQQVGYLPENPYFYDYLTGWEFLEFMAQLFAIPRSQRSRRITQLLEWVGLSVKSAKSKQMRQYSKGMLQRVGMAQALIGNPEVIFLDEPMSGLDPLGRYQMREIILALKAQGKTIFFNSHILNDVEVICDRVAILAQGDLLCTGSLDELLGTSDCYRVSGRGGEMTVLQTVVSDLDVSGETWQGTLNGGLAEAMAAIETAGGTVITVRSARPSLEDFFLKQLRDRGITVSR
jgi:ABC-2 type transport system ATP-binding protein